MIHILIECKYIRDESEKIFLPFKKNIDKYSSVGSKFKAACSTPSGYGKWNRISINFLTRCLNRAMLFHAVRYK